MPGELLRERRTGGTTLIELMASHGRWATDPISAFASP